jgi:hypothetical protein
VYTLIAATAVLFILGHFPKINLDNFEGKRNIGAEECLMG